VAWPLVGTAVGIGLATAFLTSIGDLRSRRSIGTIGLALTLLLVARKPLPPHAVYRPRPWHGVLVGIAAGVSSTIAHAAGPILALFLLASGSRRRAYRRHHRRLLRREQTLLKLPPYVATGLVDGDDAGPLAPPRGRRARRIATGWWAHRLLPQRHFDTVVAVLMIAASVHLLVGGSASPPAGGCLRKSGYDWRRAAGRARPRRRPLLQMTGRSFDAPLALAAALAMSVASPTTAADAPRRPPPRTATLLEDVTGDKALEWATREERRERQGPGDGRLRRPREAHPRHPRLGRAHPVRPEARAWYYNFWRDAEEPARPVRRTTLAEYRKEQPSWETVIDLDALGAAENENWVWHGADCLKPEYKRCIVQLSRGGATPTSCASSTSRQGVPEGRLLLPESKNSVGWLRRRNTSTWGRTSVRLE